MGTEVTVFKELSSGRKMLVRLSGILRVSLLVVMEVFRIRSSPWDVCVKSTGSRPEIRIESIFFKHRNRDDGEQRTANSDDSCAGWR